MEEQPSFEPQEATTSVSGRSRMARFVKQLALLLAASVGAAVVYALVFGHQTVRGFSDGLFVIGALLLIVGLLPLISEVFGRSTVSFRLKDQTLEDMMEEQRKRSKKDDSLTYLFGVGGIIIVVLSKYIFDEPVGGMRIAGTLLVCSGVFLLLRS